MVAHGLDILYYMVKLSGEDGVALDASIAFLYWLTVFEVPHAETNYVGYDPCGESGR